MDRVRAQREGNLGGEALVMIGSVFVFVIRDLYKYCFNIMQAQGVMCSVQVIMIDVVTLHADSSTVKHKAGLLQGVQDHYREDASFRRDLSTKVEVVVRCAALHHTSCWPRGRVHSLQGRSPTSGGRNSIGSSIHSLKVLLRT